jgi:hypothetical protein
LPPVKMLSASTIMTMPNAEGIKTLGLFARIADQRRYYAQ